MRILLTGLFILTLYIAFPSADNLFLRGKIISVDNNKVTVEVFSESCKGKRTFLIPKEVDVTKFKAGEIISFSINKVTCKTEEPIYITKYNLR